MDSDLSLEFLRVVERAAIACAHTMGQGDRHKSDQVAVEAMRELMLASQPDAIFPLEVRTVAADDAHLSSNYRRATTVISVSGMPGQDYWPYLRAVDTLLGEFGARVHWGKLHFLTPEQLAERYPESAAFIAIRRELDPSGSISSAPVPKKSVLSLDRVASLW